MRLLHEIRGGTVNSLIPAWGTQFRFYQQCHSEKPLTPSAWSVRVRETQFIRTVALLLEENE